MKIATLTAFRKTIRLWADSRYETDETGKYTLIPIAVSHELDNLLLLAKKDFAEQDAKNRRKGKPAGRHALDLPSVEKIKSRLEWKDGRVGKRGELKKLAKEFRCSSMTIRNRLREGT